MGARRSELDEYQARRGVVRETWAIQEMPDGAGFSVVWMESPDPGKAFVVAAEDDSEFAAWFRERVKEINGIELTAGTLPPLPTVTLDWRAQG